jgi:hypothetical protein
MKARLPLEYRFKDLKRQAIEARVEQKSLEKAMEKDSYSVDITAMCFVLSLIRNFGWGYSKTATRIPKLIRDVQDMLDYYINRYGHDCAMTAIKRDLAEYGVTWERSNNGRT